MPSIPPLVLLSPTLMILMSTTSHKVNHWVLRSKWNWSWELPCLTQHFQPLVWRTHSGRPSYLRTLLSVNHAHSTRSSSLITLTRPTNKSSLKITNRSFCLAAPALWNSLPSGLRQKSHSTSPQSASYSSPFDISPLVFHKRLKHYLFDLSFPP